MVSRLSVRRNCWKEIADMFDLNLGEPFRVRTFYGNVLECEYVFTYRGLFINDINAFSISSTVLKELLCGRYVVERISRLG